jgi:hypothetical protein
MFIKIDESGKVSYDLGNAKKYLSTIKDSDWNTLKSKY